MPSNKPRVATYTSDENVKKFRIIAAYKGKSMSDYLSDLITESIDKFEAENGEIKIESDT